MPESAAATTRPVTSTSKARTVDLIDEARPDDDGLPGTVTPMRAVVEASETELLLDEQARRRAAGANNEHPFGRRGPALRADTPVRHGLGFTVGAPVVLASVFELYTARSVLILILVAAFLARETAETTAPLGMP